MSITRDGHSRRLSAIIITITFFVTLATIIFLNHDSNSVNNPTAIVKRAVGNPPRKVPVAFGLPDKVYPHLPIKTPSLRELMKRAHSGYWNEAYDNGRKALDRCNAGPGNLQISLEKLKEEWYVFEAFNTIPPEFLNLEGPPFTQLYTVGFRSRNAEQDDEYTPAGEDKKVDPSQGFYNNLYSVGAGTIIALESYSPGTKIAENKKNQPLPEIHRWSYVVWTVWADAAGDGKNGLHYIVRHDIRTETTRSIMEQVMHVLTDDLDLPWPGKSFEVREDEEEGLALLGTVHGNGVTWLLHDHHTFMDYKSVQKIAIFTGGRQQDPDRPMYHMLFTLGT